MTRKAAMSRKGAMTRKAAMRRTGMARKPKLTVLLLAATAGMSLTSCGLETNASLPYTIEPASIAAQPSLDGVEVTVGSKDFTENILLAYMAEVALEGAGADVRDLTDIKGSNSARQALEAGQVDVMWEYTGTGWINYQGNELPVPGGERAQFDATKTADEQQNGITWLPYSPLNNQYTFATTNEFAAQHNLNTISDMAAFVKQNPDQAVYCMETEFISRQDGFPAALRAYGLPQGDVREFGTGAIYAAVDGGGCPFGEIFTTDGRIAGLGLKVLKDDKQAFPQYNASPTLRGDFLKEHPELADVLNPISAALTNEQMIELCKQVDVDGRDPGDVALDWMVQKGFVTSPSA